MSKFTKGEWVYDDFSAIVKTVSNNSRPICILMEEGEDDYSEEDDTNGRLIAAAPEMYRILKAFAECRHEDGMFGLMEDAQELIARIDGEDTQSVSGDWDKKFAALFTEGMHERICSNSKQVYVVMRELCPILDMLLIEENYDRPLTVHVRERLACVLRLIDH